MSVSHSLPDAPQVAALPYRLNGKGRVEILLVTSRTRRRWIIPKGKVPVGMIPSRAAEKEAFEEAGVMGRIEKVPLASYRQTVMNGLPGDKFVVRAFAMEVIDEVPTWKEMHLRQRRWFALDDAIRDVRDKEIRHILRLFAKSHRT